MTDQEKALKKAKRIYGNTAFTEHHMYYFRVGFRRSGKTFLAIGDSWEEAFEALALVFDRTK